MNLDELIKVMIDEQEVYINEFKHNKILYRGIAKYVPQELRKMQVELIHSSICNAEVIRISIR